MIDGAMEKSNRHLPGTNVNVPQQAGNRAGHYGTPLYVPANNRMDAMPDSVLDRKRGGLMDDPSQIQAWSMHSGTAPYFPVSQNCRL